MSVNIFNKIRIYDKSIIQKKKKKNEKTIKIEMQAKNHSIFSFSYIYMMYVLINKLYN